MNEARRKQVAASAICALVWKLPWSDSPRLRRYLDALIAKRYQDVDAPLLLAELHLQQTQEQQERLTGNGEMAREELAERIIARSGLISDLAQFVEARSVA